MIQTKSLERAFLDGATLMLEAGETPDFLAGMMLGIFLVKRHPEYAARIYEDVLHTAGATPLVADIADRLVEQSG